MAWEEFVEATGIAPERLEELLSLGWIETRTSAARQYFFRDADIYRVRKLERIDALERSVRSLQKFEE